MPGNNGTSESASSPWARWFVRSRKSFEKQPPSTPAPPVRRSYTPRYAGRDMLTSVPLSQRSYMIGRATDRKREDVCSEIGFSTDSLTNPVLRRASLSRHHINGRTPHSEPNLRRCASAEQSIVAATPNRPSDRGSSSWHIALSSKRDHNGEQALADDTEATGRMLRRDMMGRCPGPSPAPSSSRAWTPNYKERRDPRALPLEMPGLDPGRSPSRTYFTHKSVPNLRKDKGKGPMIDNGGLISPPRARPEANHQALDTKRKRQLWKKDEDEKRDDVSGTWSSRAASYAASSASEMTYLRSSTETSIASTAPTEQPDDSEDSDSYCEGDEQLP